MQSLWMIVAAFLFSAMGVCVKLASTHFSPWEIVMYRGLIGVASMTAVTLARGISLRHALTTRRAGMHFRRGLSGTIAINFWFFSISGLPIATAMTLNYSSPLFVGMALTAISLWAGRRPEGRMLIILAIGFAGVIVLLQPTFSPTQSVYALFGLSSSILSAIAYLSVKALSQVGEPEVRIVFYFSAMNAVSGAVATAISGAHSLDVHGGLLLLGVGITATIAQLAMTRAYGSGRTMLTANLGFTGIVFASLWGVVLFHDQVHATSLVGMGIIIISGIFATAASLKSQAPSPA